jgi:hypothetical protein
MKESKTPPNLLVDKFDTLFAEYTQLEALKREYEFFRSVHRDHKTQSLQTNSDKKESLDKSSN